MRRFIRIISLVAFSPLLNCCVVPSTVKFSNESAFSVKVDPIYARPILGWMPPTDKNNERPRQILINFLQFVRTSKYDDAASLCYFGWRLGDGIADPKDWKTSEGAEFRMICEVLNKHIKEVVISGSTIRQKSGYYSIQCKFIDTEGKKTEIIVYFIRIEGVWKLRESHVSTFHSLVDMAKYQEANNSVVPTGDKLLIFTSTSLQPRRWAYI